MNDYQQLTESQKRVIDKWENEQETEYDFCDNFRYATAGNAVEESEYDGLRMGGCCGFVDVELQCDDGTTLLYGFNYGH